MDSNYVLTAAHCVVESRPESLIVVAGDHILSQIEQVEQVRKVKDVTTHQDYDRQTFIHDIALLRLDRPLDLSSLRVEPICMPPTTMLPTAAVEETDNDPRTIGAGSVKALASGWGALSEAGSLPDSLRHVRTLADLND